MLSHPKLVIEEMLVHKAPGNETAVVCIEYRCEDDLLESIIEVASHLTNFLTNLCGIF